MVLKLEKFRTEDFHLYYSLVNNEQVMAMITERALEMDEAKKDFEKIISFNSRDPLLGYYKILEKDNLEFIGLGKLEMEDLEKKEAELGYMILPQYWGKGIASTISLTLIELAKLNTSIDKLYAIIDPKNGPSRKVLTKNGFKHKEYLEYEGLPGEILELKMKQIN